MTEIAEILTSINPAPLLDGLLQMAFFQIAILSDVVTELSEMANTHTNIRHLLLETFMRKTCFVYTKTIEKIKYIILNK